MNRFCLETFAHNISSIYQISPIVRWSMKSEKNSINLFIKSFLTRGNSLSKFIRVIWGEIHLFRFVFEIWLSFLQSCSSSLLDKPVHGNQIFYEKNVTSCSLRCNSFWKCSVCGIFLNDLFRRDQSVYKLTALYTMSIICL